VREELKSVHETNDMRGAVTLRLEDAAGYVVHHQHRPNRIVKSGRANVARLFGGVSSGTQPGKVTHVAVGTDGRLPTDDDPALFGERARNPITEVTYNEFDETVGNATVKRTRVSLTAVFDFNQANDATPLREAGVFTAASAGTMYNRVVFDPVTKANTFKLTLIWDIVF
jgi:hypothetical protein